MSSEDAYQSLGAILLAIALISQLFSAVGFYVLRDVQPVKKRFNVISVMTWYGLLGLNINMYLGLTAQLRTCWTGLVWRILFLNPVIGFAIQAAELYLVYDYLSNLSKGYSGDIPEDEEGTRQREAIERLKKKIGWRNTIRWYLGLHSIQVTLAAVSIAYALSTGQGFEGTCRSVFITITDALNALILILALIILGWKLRGAKDIYWVKWECNLLGIVSIIFGVGGFILQFFPSVARVGTALLAICFSAMAVISYAVPTIMAIIKRVRTGASGTSGTDIDTGGTDMDDQKATLIFPRHKKISAVFESERSLAKVHAYIAKTQVFEHSWALLFLEELKKYHEKPEIALPGHAEMKKQKFLGKNAYLPLNCVSQDTKDEVIEMINKATNLAAEQERTSEQEKELERMTSELRTVFSGPQREIEVHLSKTLFKAFFTSDEWKSLDLESNIRTTMDETSMTAP